MKNSKSAGPDNIVTEMIKTAGEAGIETVTEMSDIKTGTTTPKNVSASFHYTPQENRIHKM